MENETIYAFSQTEYANRIHRVRQAMEKEGLDVLLVHRPENIFYLSGYQTLGYYEYQCMILPIYGEAVLLVRELEESNIGPRSWIKKSVIYSDTENPVSVTNRTIKNLGNDFKRIGVEKSSWFLTVANYEQLHSDLQYFSFCDASEIVNKVRLIKSQAEIACIREAAGIVKIATQASVDAITAGKSDRDVASATMTALISGGSEYTGMPPFIAAGSASAIAHVTWEGRKLRAGDPVLLEIPACIKRYHAANSRTVIIGKPLDRWMDISKIVIDGLEAVINTVKPGVTSDTVDNACRDIINRAGFGENYRHRCGYSIGIGFPPNWGEGYIMSLRANDTSILRSNMTFHVPVAIFLYGEVCIGLSETILVTDKGCEVLTGYPRRLIVVQ